MEIEIGYEYNGRYYKSIINRSMNSHFKYLKIDGKIVYTVEKKEDNCICKKCKKHDKCEYHITYPDIIINFCVDFKSGD